MPDRRWKRLQPRLRRESFVPGPASIADSALIAAFVQRPRSGFTPSRRPPSLRQASSALLLRRSGANRRACSPTETKRGRESVPPFCLHRRLLVLLRLLCFLLGCHSNYSPFPLFMDSNDALLQLIA